MGAYAHAVIILTLHARNTANITSVASINTFSREANFITALRFLTRARPYPIPREDRQRVRTFANKSAEGRFFYPPITTSASMVSEARTKMVSKEASFIMPSASYPAMSLVDSIKRRHGEQLHSPVSTRG